MDAYLKERLAELNIDESLVVICESNTKVREARNCRINFKQDTPMSCYLLIKDGKERSYEAITYSEFTQLSKLCKIKITEPLLNNYFIGIVNRIKSYDLDNGCDLFEIEDQISNGYFMFLSWVINQQEFKKLCKVCETRTESHILN